MRRAAAVVAVLLALFGAMAWHAARLESPTYDEPTHTLAGLVSLTRHDFRLNTEHPPLWKLWASLPALFARPIALDTTARDWQQASIDRGATPPFVQATLYRQPQNDPEALLMRARFMMLLLGVMLGALIALWAWRLAGALAAVVAALFFAFDPNFLGHAPLVTNDVAMSLGFLAAMYATWRVGQGASIRRVLMLAVASTAALLIKFSAVLVAPIVAVLLVIRALSPAPWRMFGRGVQTRSRRIAGVALIGAFCLAFAWGGIWAAYDFRFHVSPDSDTRVNLAFNVDEEAIYSSLLKTGQIPTLTHAPGMDPNVQPVSLVTRALLTADRMELLPEAFIDGVMYARASAMLRPTYLLGETSLVGRWYYFPVAFLVKTPLGTLLAAVAALAILGLAYRRARWELLCLMLPPSLFLAYLMASNLNIGLRHAFPVYPFAFVAIGVAAAKAWALRPRVAGLATAVLAALVIAESVAASPAYLPFFNLSAGGAEGGLAFLADSNLDWGQGLKLLARWQQEHGQPLIYLWYYGTGEPERYGVHAISLNHPSAAPAGKREVLAMSASILQGLAVDTTTAKAMPIIQSTLKPIDVVGGCIYLYRARDVLPLFGLSPQ